MSATRFILTRALNVAIQDTVKNFLTHRANEHNKSLSMLLNVYHLFEIELCDKNQHMWVFLYQIKCLKNV